MSGLRVYELAKELKMDASALVAKLEELNIAVKSHASSLTDDQARKLRDAVLGGNPQEVVEKRIKPGIIRRRVLKHEESKDDAPKADATTADETADPARQASPALSAPAAESQAAGETQKKKKQKRPVEAVIVSRPEIVQPSRPKLEQPAHKFEPRHATPPPVADEPQPDLNKLVDSKLPPGKRKEPYKKPSIVREKITRLVQPTDQEEPAATPGETPESAEDKKKKKAKKKIGGKEATPEVVDPKKVVKKPFARKREIITKRDMVEDSDRMYKPSKRKKKGLPKKAMKGTAITTPKAAKRIIRISGAIQVGELAHRMGIKSYELIKKLVDLGIMASINQIINFDEALLVAADYGYEVENVQVEEENLIIEDQGKLEDFVKRPPIVTVMGHVDHGKTTLLDTIRRTTVVDGEQGGITQHIGAYTVELPQGRITFIDTPGHEAFTAMRARGASVTDLVIIVVAAEDGVMDRTREAINHARAAEVPIIVAVNKIDKPEANPDRVMRQLADLGLNPEEWGGDTIFAKISAKKNIGVKELLDSILLQAEMLELTANQKVAARGAILEARIEKGRGIVGTALVSNGTLKPQDIVVAGPFFGRIRAMFDDNGKPVNEATPGTAVQVIGLGGVPQAGDEFVVVKDERVARQVVEHRTDKARATEMGKVTGRVSLDTLFERMQGIGGKELKVILKADVQGSVEAIAESLKNLTTDKCKLVLIHAGVGAINDTDIMLAGASQAVVVGFNVKPDGAIRRAAEQAGVTISVYGIIYELLDDIQRRMLGQLEPTFKEKIIGHADVKTVFPIAKLGKVAGCIVSDGKIQRSGHARVLRNDREIWKGKLANLKKFKDDVREVSQGSECGIFLENYEGVQEGDVIEVYILEEIAPTL